MITQSPPMTYQDLLRLPEDLLRHELIDGEHYVSPAPALQHQRIVLNLGRILSTFVRARRCGEVLIAPVDVLFSQRDVVEPDVLYVAAAHADRLRERYVAGAPDLVIEVLSPASRGVDRIRKRRLYEAHGVAEYWIVDPAAQTIEIHRGEAPQASGPPTPSTALTPQSTAAGRMARHATLSLARGEAVETPLLPDLRLALADVFE